MDIASRFLGDTAPELSDLPIATAWTLGYRGLGHSYSEIGALEFALGRSMANERWPQVPVQQTACRASAAILVCTRLRRRPRRKTGKRPRRRRMLERTVLGGIGAALALGRSRPRGAAPTLAAVSDNAVAADGWSA